MQNLRNLRGRPFARMALLFAALLGSSNLAQAQTRPQRIVSLNLCTDEMLMRLVEPARIASITYLSQQPVNEPIGLTDIASKLKVNHGLAEEVLMQQPDLIVTQSYSGGAATALLKKLGYRIVVFEPESSFDDIRANVLKMGEAVGEKSKAEQMVADFNQRLTALESEVPPGAKPIFADIGVNNYVSGKGTLYAQVIEAGGYRTLGEALGIDGYRNVTLEEILKVKPALISTATPWANPPSISTQALRHPALREMAAHTPSIEIPERFTTCGSPSVLGAVELLVKARVAATKTGAAQ